ncbi:flagellar biosynthetic protein FliO [Lentisphaerota bacterium WC36G]|nr:flagellar biosynthetic protein FliO [Lentisphaerae bacterium WC36]
MKLKTKNNIILLVSVLTLLLNVANSSAIEDPNKPFGPKLSNKQKETVAKIKSNDTETTNNNKKVIVAPKKISQEKAKEPISSPDLPISQAVVAILIIFGFIGAVYVIIRKYGSKMGIGNFANNIITVKARQQLDAKNAVSVIKVYEDEYVVGVGINGITLLSKLTPITESELFSTDQGDNVFTTMNDETEELYDVNDIESSETNNTPFINQFKNFVSNKTKISENSENKSATYSEKLDNAVNDSVNINISPSYNHQKGNDNNDKV